MLFRNALIVKPYDTGFLPSSLPFFLSNSPSSLYILCKLWFIRGGAS